jgi:hypothetical protein
MWRVCASAPPAHGEELVDYFVPLKPALALMCTSCSHICACLRPLRCHLAGVPLAMRCLKSQCMLCLLRQQLCNVLLKRLQLAALHVRVKLCGGGVQAWLAGHRMAMVLGEGLPLPLSLTRTPSCHPPHTCWLYACVSFSFSSASSAATRICWSHARCSANFSVVSSSMCCWRAEKSRRRSPVDTFCAKSGGGGGRTVTPSGSGGGAAAATASESASAPTGSDAGAAAGWFG